jgi:tripartite-type tricarboxylate transporter receptor subunit TctC
MNGPANAQDWPSKPLRMVIPYPPGGPSDVSTRIVMDRAAQSLGQPIVFDNKAGASGMIGAEFVKNAPVDNHTFLTTTTAMVCITRHLQPIPFDPDKDFVTVSRMCTSWGIFAIHPSVPARTVAEFVAYAKANPGKINFGSSGLATITHLFGEMLQLEAGIKMTHVPYRGSAPATNALVAAEVQAQFDQTCLPHVKAGKLKALGVTTPQRVPLAPELPTIAESGLPGYEARAWYGLVASSRVPRDIVLKLNAQINELLKSPQFRDALITRGAVPMGGSVDDFAKFLTSEVQKYAAVVKASGIRAD